jgi:hypothetical protein
MRNIKKQTSVLLVSPNPDLHRTLEMVAATYNSRFLSAESAKKGVGLIASGEPDCVIFDLATLSNPRHKQAVKQKLEKVGVPTLWLNDGTNGIAHVPGSQKLEPLVKFIMDNCGRTGGTSTSNILQRLFSLVGFRQK